MSSEFADTHNMVAILTKSKASEGFDQIIDFLNGSYIKYALTSMSAKCTSWNEFSSAMASAVICLSTGQKFNFSKYIFESLVRNVDSSSKFCMYPRVGKGCLGVETPLFKGMSVVGEPEEQGDEEEQVQGNDNDVAQGADTTDDVQDQFIPSPTPPTPPPQLPQDIPSTSQL
nr:hypothetical protein [Tanacetum cinerariifolium]